MFPDKDLFHYTSADAFLGIMTNRVIWASNIAFLNDEKEYRYTTKILRPHLDEIWKKSEHKELVERLVRLIENSDGGPTYVTSLSEKPDLLSQWRAYCRDGGYSIGLDNKAIPEIAKRCQLEIVKCSYCPNQHQKLVADFADQLFEQISEKGASITDRNQALQFHADHVYGQINRLANEIKHPAFEEEQEWRFVKTFVYANHPNLRYRAGKGMLVPYFEIPLVSPEKPELFIPISEVYVAPHRNSELSEKTLTTFLAGERAKYDEPPFVRVKRSIAPYREI
ncbi:DUF2971 domain-containing protein [Marinobacter sp.]|uniref:DUF2971 domain-containing protein n=1 Tax=Marinobacter sp. TaxID=50741 RepID=UPI00384F6536